MERDVAHNSGMIIRARRKGTVTYVDATRIEIGGDTYQMRKFVGLNERTCQNQKPIVQVGQKVEKGEPIADGAATFQGELALGRNVLVGFMAWDGFNFEDAIIISEELVKNDVYTSIHIEEFDIEIRETKLGREEFTRDIPNVSEKALRNLDENGIVRIGTYVRPGDILVGKVSPKSKTELTPEEKLLHAIFGRAGEDVKNDSLDVPSGVEGIVIDTQKFSRRMSLSEDERKVFEKALNRSRKRRARPKSPRPSGRWPMKSKRSYSVRWSTMKEHRSFATRRTSTSPNRLYGSSSTRSTSVARKLQGRRGKGPQDPLAQRRGYDRRARSQAELDEARRRAA